MGDHHTESAARQRRSARNDWSLQPETISEKSAMREKRSGDFGDQRQPIPPQRRVRRHHHHLVEECVHRRP